MFNLSTFDFIHHMRNFGIWANLDVAIIFSQVVNILFYVLCFLSFKNHFTNPK